ncbi:unnamed protein product [Caenorhabditis nigoni]
MSSLLVEFPQPATLHRPQGQASSFSFASSPQVRVIRGEGSDPTNNFQRQFRIGAKSSIWPVMIESSF